MELEYLLDSQLVSNLPGFEPYPYCLGDGAKSGRMRCWECKDEVSGVGGCGVKIYQNLNRLASRGQNIEF